MTRKEQKIAMVQNYVNYAKSINIHQQALKDCAINFGVDGRSAEMLAKLALNNYRFKGVAEPGKSDTIKKINGEFKTIEIKTGCGELATILTQDFKVMNGKRTTADFRNAKFDELPKRNNCFESDFVVYLPEPDLDFPIEYQAYVLATSDFEYILRSMGMIRYKQTTDLKNRGGDYYDRFAIADFKGSEKRYNTFYELLEEYGTSFDLWLEENEIE